MNPTVQTLIRALEIVNRLDPKAVVSTEYQGIYIGIGLTWDEIPSEDQKDLLTMGVRLANNSSTLYISTL